MASIGLNLQRRDESTRSGARTGAGGTWPILLTALIPNGKGESLLCSGVQEKGKGHCGYEAVRVKLLCGQEVSCTYDLEQVTWSFSTCLIFSTLNVTAIYPVRFYK